AEAQLHAATAQVGVAQAALLPAISLSANSGSAAVQLSQLTAPGTRFWSLGGSLSQTLFAGGTLVHRKRAAVALMDQAADSYRSVVLQAFRQVADVLAALQADAAALAAQTRAESAAAQSLSLILQNLQLGSVSNLDLIQAEHDHETAGLALVQARAGALGEPRALYPALRGRGRRILPTPWRCTRRSAAAGRSPEGHEPGASAPPRSRDVSLQRLRRLRASAELNRDASAAAARVGVNAHHGPVQFGNFPHNRQTQTATLPVRPR